MHIKIDSNFHEVRRQFAHMAKQVDFAAAVALTKTAQDVQRSTPQALERELDNPTEFTKRGTFVVPARKGQLEATVGFKDRQARYMALQIAGGVRQPGPGGIKLPGEIQLNAFGNIPRGLIAKLKAAAKDGSLSGTVSRRLGQKGDRRKGAAPIQLFYGQPRGSGWKDAPVGIWRRIPPSTPGGKGKLIPVIVFERTAAVYRAKFDLVDHARTTAAQRFPAHFSAAFIRAIQTAR
jgi:hypothetical protein